MLELLVNGQPLPQEGEATVEAGILQEWDQLELTLEPVADAVDARLLLGGIDLGRPAADPFERVWRWRAQAGALAGALQGELSLVLRGGATLRRSFTLRLRPRAIDQENYASLIRAVVDQARSLALQLGGQALEGAALVPLSEPDRAALEEALLLLQRHGRMLAACIAALEKRPNETLRQVIERRRLGDPATGEPLLRDLTRGPFEQASDAHVPGATLRALRTATGGRLPLEVTARRSIRSYDLPEHRFAAWLAADVVRRARMVGQLAESALRHYSLESGAAAMLTSIAARSERLARDIDALRARPPLAGLPLKPQLPQGQLLRRDRRYRPLLQIWRELRAAPLLSLDLSEILLPISDLATLYEIWATLDICAALARLGEVQTQQLLAPLGDGWTLRLERAQPLLTIAIAGATLRLRYQPRYEPYGGLADAFGSLDRYLRIPDLSLELERGAERSLAIFDAKYRLAPDGYPPQDALDDVYAYKGSLGYGGRPAVRYAALLFPGRSVAEDYGGIAVLPLLPENDGPLGESLERLIASWLADER